MRRVTTALSAVATLCLLACGGDKGETGSLDPHGGDDTDTTSPSCTEHVLEDIQIPLRDGVELSAFMRRPVDLNCQLPTVLIFTPYDKENSRTLWFSDDGSQPLFDSRDYAFVVADWRGYYGSEGSVGGSDQQGADGHDLVEWIAEQPFSNGAVGMYGPSALGGVQFAVAEEKPPHLAAIVPIFASPTDGYEKWNPGGVLRREYLNGLGVLYGTTEETFAEHPTIDAAWIYLASLYHPELVEVPVLHVHGFFDLNAEHTLAGSEQLTAVSERPLLIGEWHHFASGGETDWAAGMTKQELLWWDGEKVIQHNALAFFERHLQGIASDADEWSPVRYQRGDDWLEAETWPPQGAQELTFYLGDGTLQASSPGAADLDFPYSPADPSPTVGGQTLHYAYEHGPAYQDDVLSRADALVFVTEVLDADVELAGPIAASLQAKTTGTDTHFVLRLTDVSPDGQHLLLTDGVRRMALHESLEELTEISPNTQYTVPVEFTNPQGWRFEAGHRIGLILTSSHSERFEKSTNVADHYLFDESVAVDVTNTLVTGASTLTLTIAP